METFGARLKNIRTDKKLTQMELAIKTKTMPWLISRYERDKTKPNIKFVERLINELKIDANELFPQKSKLEFINKVESNL